MKFTSNSRLCENHVYITMDEATSKYPRRFFHSLVLIIPSPVPQSHPRHVIVLPFNLEMPVNALITKHLCIFYAVFLFSWVLAT